MRATFPALDLDSAVPMSSLSPITCRHRLECFGVNSDLRDFEALAVHARDPCVRQLLAAMKIS
jgi:hypothetical protein